MSKLYIDDIADLREYERQRAEFRTDVIALKKRRRISVDPDHEKQLTRDEITAAVHYIHFSFSANQIDLLRSRPSALVVDHPEYVFETQLNSDNIAELSADLAG